MGDEQFAKARLCLQDANHLGFSDPHHFAVYHAEEGLTDQLFNPTEKRLA
jgi:hypothetical protein